MTTRLLLVGSGKMGGALLAGWSTKPSLAISVLDPNDDKADYTTVSDIPASLVFDIIVFAVKPQVMAGVVGSITHLVTPQTLVLSIAAGKTIGFFENLLGAEQPIIRAMPNTPALVGKGMTVLCGSSTTTEEQRQLAMNLMAAVGHAEWIDDEALMNAVTAVSGSGPAYVFHLIEALCAAGETAGLSHELSMTLAQKTVIGSAALADHDQGTTAATLRQNVTSPGGTTEAALRVLMSDTNNLTDLMTRAVRAAKLRGEDLA